MSAPVPNYLMPWPRRSAQATAPIPATAVIPFGPATLTVTETTLIVAVGSSRLILSPDGIVLDAPRIDFNPDR